MYPKKSQVAVVFVLLLIMRYPMCHDHANDKRESHSEQDDVAAAIRLPSVVGQPKRADVRINYRKLFSTRILEYHPTKNVLDNPEL
jgi:hypothetical protein